MLGAGLCAPGQALLHPDATICWLLDYYLTDSEAAMLLPNMQISAITVSSCKRCEPLRKLHEEELDGMSW